MILRKQLYLTFVFLLYSFQVFIAENFRASQKTLKSYYTEIIYYLLFLLSYITIMIYDKYIIIFLIFSVHFLQR